MQVKRSTLAKVITDFTTVATQFRALRKEYGEEINRLKREHRYRVKEVEQVLEASKDFHLQHLVNI